ncbi:colicin immunity domain-containing protein [Arthrobacter sp. M2012083]|uniref:colicin immunity domain-containing protein n=1 Tax=Arthrobacter sp. M2012083 TaxID=1197706 RepID=UPI0002DE91A7|nr:colicin immunity domain-containing protein [Arthrobacter sp. M2012083]
MAPYGVLLGLLVNNRVSADEFEALFLPLYKGDLTKWSEEIYKILDQLFYAVDDYNHDPDLRDNDVNENELRNRAALALRELRKLAVTPGPTVAG